MARANVRSTLECQEDSGGMDCMGPTRPEESAVERCRFHVHRALEAHGPGKCLQGGNDTIAPPMPEPASWVWGFTRRTGGGMEKEA
jgi:hypothetical protein